NPRIVTTATGTDHLAGRQDPLPWNGGPAKGFGFADDMLIMSAQAGTQWDGLAHIFHKGKMWNGYSAAEHSSDGAARNGIQRWRGRLVMRGVLVDFPRLRNVAALEPGYAITADDLEEALRAQRCSVHSGDALLVRTGFLSVRRHQWGDYSAGSAPGLSL